MKRLGFVFGITVACMGLWSVALGQDITNKLGSNSGATFTVEDSDGNDILVLEAKDQALIDGSPNIIGGHDENSVTSGVVGAVVGGGGITTSPNTVTDNHGTVGGGSNNQAGDGAGLTDDNNYATVGGGGSNTASSNFATVGGGASNTASGYAATVGGGGGNTASGLMSTVPGGTQNTAAGDYSFAGGYRAEANHQGSFVWADSTGLSNLLLLQSAADNAWYVRASGGVTFYTSADVLSWVHVVAGGNSWIGSCDRANKENFVAVDKRETLEKLAAMPITEYNLKSQDPSIIHFGPVAQDFAAAFGYGEKELGINMMDAVGVALASVQGLYQVVKEKDEALAAQQQEIKELKGAMARNTALEARLDRLEQALAPRMARAAKDVTP